MNHRQTVTEISKRLPRLKRRDVAEMLEVMTELWLEALAQPGQTVTVADLGKLLVEVQTFRSGGAVGRRTLKRVYVRFRPTRKFRQFVLNAYIEAGWNFARWWQGCRTNRQPFWRQCWHRR